MKDSQGIEHAAVSIEQEPGLGHVQPDQTIHYDGGLKYYFVDGREITESEFFRLFPQLKPSR